MSKRSLERGLEWEPAADPIVFSGITFPSPFLKGVHKVTISRDEHMMLQLVAEGRLENNAELLEVRRNDEARPVGSFIDPVEITFEAFGGECSIRGYVDGLPDHISFSRDERAPFTQHGSHIKFSRRWSQRFDFSAGRIPRLVDLGPEAWRADWFINGPHMPFARFTTRLRTGTFVRERSGTTISLGESPGGGDRRDHFLIDAADIRFSINEVPEEFSPPWCHGLSLEFTAPIPDPDTRAAVAELVSFIVGRRLVPIGSTLFDSQGWAIEQDVRDPWGQNLRGECERPDSPPVPIEPLSDDVEQILSELLPLYLAARTPLGLKDALSTYWLANEAYSGFDLAFYSAAVEALKKGWFASTKTKSKGEHLPRDKFDELTKELLAPVYQRLKEVDAPTAIGNKMAGSFRMGSNEQLTAFLDEIELPIGKLEKAAIAARNVPAHGGLGGNTDQRKLVAHANVYCCLFERVFLKLLGYEGPYVDRATQGHPARLIDEPCGGSVAD